MTRLTWDCLATGEYAVAVSVGLGRIVALYDLLIHFIPDPLTYSVPVFLKRHCDRILGQRAAGRRRGRRVAAGDRGARRARPHRHSDRKWQQRQRDPQEGQSAAASDSAERQCRPGLVVPARLGRTVALHHRACT